MDKYILQFETKEYELSNICSVQNKKYNPLIDKLNYKCIELENIEQGSGIINGYFNSKDQLSIKNQFDETCILFGKLRPYLKKFYLPDFKGVCSSEIIVLQPKEPVIRKYLFYLIQSYRFLSVASKSCGSKMPRADWNYMESTVFKIPPKSIQNKIATFLNLYYKKIELQKKKIEQLEKLSFDVLFSNKYHGKLIRLGDILSEVIEKTYVNNQFEVVSSTKTGLYYQKDYFNKEIASENNIGYKILKLNQIVISPQNLWLGNINYNNKIEIGIVSPSYKIFDINTQFNKTFIAHLLKTKRAIYEYEISSEQGASIVRRNLNMELFYEIIFKIPERNIQDKIAMQLNMLFDKVAKEKQKLELMEQYKQGLLQQMFV